MRKAKTDLTPKPYRLLKTDIAAKLSPRSEGCSGAEALRAQGSGVVVQT